MDANGVEKAVVVALADYIGNEFVAQLSQRCPERFIPGASLNPVAYSSCDELEDAARVVLKNGPFKVLKLHPRLNRYDPLDPRCLRLLEEIASWSRPPLIWLCTHFRYHGAVLRKSPVDTLHELVGRFAGLKFVLLHGGGADILRLAEAVRDCPNAFLDISFTLHRYQNSSVALDMTYLFRTFERRIVFGSDFPEISIGQALRDFRSLARNLPSRSRAQILGANLAEILGM